MAAAADGVEVADDGRGKAAVSYRGVRLLEYRYGRDKPKSYIHPLCLADGRPITLDSPADHVHHRGLMAAWSEVNGIDFWGEVNPGRHGQIEHQRFERLGGGREAELVAINHWVAEGKLLLVERRTVRVPRPLKEGVWLDWTTELKAASGAVKLAAGEHVYNGLGVRVIPAMDGGGVLNANGTRRIEQANGEAARWCAYHGAGAGVGMFDHPGNPRHPNAFFVMNKAFGYLSATPTYREAFELAGGQSIRFRWGVLAFSGAPEAGVLGARFEAWEKER